MKKILLFLILFGIFHPVFSQDITQNVRGTIVDMDTKTPLIGATVKITSIEEKLFAAACDLDGNFIIKDVPVGKHTVEISFVGYTPKIITIIVNSGRETILNEELDEASVVGDEVVVTYREKGDVNNEMSTVSSLSFTIEETNRYAGSRMDPARMMSNFAGAQGTDDSRNDLVIRGNSPLGILYKVEGIDIPNPNHFATSGSTGGPVSILNNKFLSNSDFFMSAFPAEYGNSTAGVFDLNLRNGNNSIHEFSGQFGFLGTEVLFEGPLSSKSKASYIIGGRYSTFALMQGIGLNIGTDAVPIYGDAAFKFNFPLKNGGAISLFGMGGASEIAIKISDQLVPAQDAFGEQDRDQYFGTQMYVTGLTYKKPINNKMFFKSTLAYSRENQHSNHEYILRDLNPDSTWNYLAAPYNMMGYSFSINKVSAYLSVNQKINKKHLIKYGMNLDMYTFDMHDSIRVDIADSTSNFIKRWDYKSSEPSFLAQLFVQWRYKINAKLTLNAGLHSQYFSFSNSLSPVEPRLGLKYDINAKQNIALGGGLHSQTLPMYTYTYHQFDGDGNKVLHNQFMDFTKSIHSVLSYSLRINKSLRFKSEVYYQHLYNIPVEYNISSFSLINQGSGFQRFFPDSLQNIGTGQNYGMEFTIEKFFDKSVFFLGTVSLYESKYRGSDGILRDTDFNGNYIINVLAGKELKIGKKDKHTISLGGKVTYAGGKRYGFVDTIQTNLQKEIIFLDEGYNTLRFKNYFRVDCKINYVFNAQKVTHEFGLDLVNILNTQNFLGLTYVPNPNNPSEPYQFRNQLGFLPIFYYKLDFKVSIKK